MDEPDEKKFLVRRKCTIVPLKVQDERSATIKKVTAILQKPEDDRTSEESEILKSCHDVVIEIARRQEKRNRVKARIEEIEDPPEELEEKCIRLAAAISRATSLTVYTGAGISTAASIPDYRGTNGVWTRLQQGKEIGNHDLSQAEPTLTHMALYALYRAGILKYVVSQNCDGLHLRSGIPKTLLSEVHGNMYVEVCRNCKPPREYLRLFDVTEKTARYAHSTGRVCHKCNSSLQDSIVHFGERGNLLWPINWNGACRAAKQADVILCLGSSLKVLKKYPWLWQMDKPVSKRAQLYIVNLQWTPKDENATLKINGKCDQIMKIVMSHLGIDIPSYNRNKDPIFYHAIRLQNSELSTTSQPVLEAPVVLDEKEDIQCNEEPKTTNNKEEENVTEIDDDDDDVEIIEEKPKIECMCEDSVGYKESDKTKVEEQENLNSPVIVYQEPLSAYPAPLFTALPFLSMGLPFPPMYIYPPLSQLLYYQPLVQLVTNPLENNVNSNRSDSSFGLEQEEVEEKSLPKPACTFCMENEGSLICLYYQRDNDGDPVAIPDVLESTEILDKSAVDSDENTPSPVTAKNPGWFGKGYRKGLKRKR